MPTLRHRNHAISASATQLHGNLPHGAIQCVHTGILFATAPAFDTHRALFRTFGRAPTVADLEQAGLVSTKNGMRWPSWPVSNKRKTGARR
jgi:hypothetical protein